MQMPDSHPRSETFLGQNISAGNRYGSSLNEESARVQGGLPQVAPTSFSSPWSNPQTALQVANNQPGPDRSQYSSMGVQVIDAPSFGSQRVGRYGDTVWERTGSPHVASISPFSYPSNRQAAMRVANNASNCRTMKVQDVNSLPRHAATEIYPVEAEERPPNPCSSSLASPYANPTLGLRFDNTQNGSDRSHRRTIVQDIAGRPNRVHYPQRTANLAVERIWAPQMTSISSSSNTQATKQPANTQSEDNRQIHSGSSPDLEPGSVDRPIRTGFANVIARTAKCDVCNKRNAIGMTRCMGCGWQSCHACTLANGCLRTHSAGGSYHEGPISESDLIELPPKATRRSRKRKFDDQALDEGHEKPAEDEQSGLDKGRRCVRNTKGTSIPAQSDIPATLRSSRRRAPKNKPPTCMSDTGTDDDVPEIKSPAAKRRKVNTGTTETRVSDIDPTHQSGTPSLNEGTTETEVPDSIFHDANILFSFSIAAFRETEKSRAMALLEQGSTLWPKQRQGDFRSQMDRTIEDENRTQTQPSDFIETSMTPESDLSDNSNNNNNDDHDFEMDIDSNSSSDSEDI